MRRIITLLVAMTGAVVGLVIWRQAPARPFHVSADRTIASAPALPTPQPQEPVRVAPLYKEEAVRSHYNQTLLHSKMREWFRAQSLDSEEDQDRLMKELVGLLTDQNVAEIVRSLSAEELHTPFSIAALHRWMQVDPVNATNWTASRAGETEPLLISAAAENWANHKAALLTYVDQLPENGWKETFLTATGLEFSLKDPEGALDLAKRMKPGPAQTNLFQAVVCDWVSLEPNKALNWIIDVNEPRLREQLTAAAAKSYALTEPNLAASWLVSTIESKEVMREAVLNIVETWGAKDPETAAKWVTSTLEGDTRKAAIDIISSHQ